MRATAKRTEEAIVQDTLAVLEKAIRELREDIEFLKAMEPKIKKDQ